MCFVGFAVKWLNQFEDDGIEKDKKTRINN